MIKDKILNKDVEIKKKSRFKSLCSFGENVEKKNTGDGPYETAILEKTIVKIGALLAQGFGEAGTKIIADNMSKTGIVDPMIPGNKIVAIFGFCDIRDFTKLTSVL